jgi:hypothetical protein
LVKSYAVKELERDANNARAHDEDVVMFQKSADVTPNANKQGPQSDDFLDRIDLSGEECGELPVDIEKKMTETR